MGLIGVMTCPAMTQGWFLGFCLTIRLMYVLFVKSKTGGGGLM